MGGLARWWSGLSVSVRLITAIAVAALVLITMLRMAVQPASAGEGQGCETSGEVAYRKVGEQSVLIPLPGRLVGFTWVFDADDVEKKEKTVLGWQLPPEGPASLGLGDQLEVSFATLLTSKDSETIPEDQATATAVVTGSGVHVSVCVDTSGASPDRYTSAIVFEDQQIKAAPLAVDVTVKHRAEWIPLSAMVVGLALALIVLVLSIADDRAVKPAKIVGLALGALLVAAGTARPWEAWQDNPTWGKGLFDVPTLAAATALAFTGAMVASTTIVGIRDAATEVGATQPAGDEPDAETEHVDDEAETEDVDGDRADGVGSSTPPEASP